MDKNTYVSNLEMVKTGNGTLNLLMILLLGLNKNPKRNYYT